MRPAPSLRYNELVDLKGTPVGFFSALINPVADYFADKERSEQNRARSAVKAKNKKGKAKIDAENQVIQDKFAADTAYRGALIGAQRGGLMSTILNLGGAAGDPDKPIGLGLSYGVGTQAAATEDGALEPTLKKFKAKKLPAVKESFLFKQSYDFDKSI